MSSPRLRRLAAATILMAVVRSASAQEAAGATDDAGIQLHFGVEARRDRFRYHFDNPSTLDTPALVPHFFEQQYVADNVWAVVAVRFTAGARWEISGGATPQRTATATDYDTFLIPNGPVVVSGTTGGAAMRSFRFSQTVELSRVRTVHLVAGYRFRLDRADFQLGHKTVTRNGAVVLVEDVTTPEVTRSQVHELLIGIIAARDLDARWRVSLDADVSPTTVGRLVVTLPEKYPGQDLRFLASGLAGSARATLVRRHVRWPVDLSVDAGRSWSYRSTNRLSRDLLGVRLAVAKVW